MFVYLGSSLHASSLLQQKPISFSPSTISKFSRIHLTLICWRKLCLSQSLISYKQHHSSVLIPSWRWWHLGTSQSWVFRPTTTWRQSCYCSSPMQTFAGAGIGSSQISVLLRWFRGFTQWILAALIIVTKPISEQLVFEITVGDYSTGIR